MKIYNSISTSFHLTIFISLIVFNLVAIAITPSTEKLVFAIDIVRHADRTPTKLLPNTSYIWKQGLGELTAEGMQQAFQLGQEFRKEYIKKYHLLPSNYQSDTMYVRSTDYNRTIMSAQSLLFGLYPLGTGPNLTYMKPALPQAFQPIPIHTVPQKYDTLLNTELLEDQLLVLQNKYVFNSKEWQKEYNALQTKLKRWSEVTGWPTKSSHNITYLGDYLYICQLHNVPIPKGISAAEAKQIIYLGYKELNNRFKPYPIGKKISHELLIEINNYLEQAIKNKTSLKYVLFVAHDTTLLSLMSALQAPQNQRVPYAADLKFELFEDRGKNYFVKIFYNDIPLPIPACKNNICSLTQFAKLITQP